MRAVVVGAGVGGLAAAVELAAGGAHVTVLERAPRVGGKIREHAVAGHAVDAGPTVLTMRWALDELFDAAGASFGAAVRLTRATRLATHVWDDGASLDLFDDVERNADAIGALAGPDEARGYRAMQLHARRILDTVQAPFLRAQRPGAMDLLRAVGSIGLGAFARVDGHRTMARALASFFRDPRLRQLFGRYATYSGSSPYVAPATLLLITEVEREGVWLVEGGMAQVAGAMKRLAVTLGAEIRTGCAARAVTARGGRAGGVELEDGERIDADVVIMNADVGAVAGGAFGASAALAVPSPGPRSLSALTWAVVARADSAPPRGRHHVLFGSDAATEFGDLFERRALPRDPTVYVCALDRGGPREPAPGADERFFCIVNAPANGDRGGPSPEEIESCERTVFARVARWASWHPRGIVRTTPLDFERAFPGAGGAIYGAASHGPMSALTRPAARTRLPGLYLAGGSAHPGAGVPMATISGRLAAQAARADWSSTRRSRGAGIAGSTSMP